MATQIDHEHRQVLYEIVISDLAAIGDIAIELKAGRIPEAQILRTRYVNELRLLDDLSWSPEEKREVFELTIDKDTLLQLLERYHSHYTELLTDQSDPDHIGTDANALRVLHDLSVQVAAA